MQWASICVIGISCTILKTFFPSDFYVRISADNKVYGQFVLLSFSFSSIGICYANIGYMYAFYVLRGMQCRVCFILFHILIWVFNSYLEMVSEYWVTPPLLDILKIIVFFDYLTILFPHIASFHFFITLSLI